MHVFKVSRRRYNSKCHDLYIRIKKTLNCNKSLKMICHLSPYQTLLLLLLLAISSLAAGECPTWFKEAEDGTCECGSHLRRVIKCNNSTKRVSIIAGNCMTYDNRTNSVVVGTCLTIYLNSTLSAKTAYFTLPQDVSNLNLLCRHRKTTGLLCGQCIDGYGWAINTLQCRCAKCNSSLASVYLVATVLLPTTAFFLFVILFRPNLPSGKMLSYIMFCQMYLYNMQASPGLYNYLTHSNDIIRRATNFSLALWSYCLSFLYLMGHETCISTSMTKLHLISLHYVYVVYPLLLICITWMCIELHARDFRLVVILWKPFHRCFAKVRRNWSASDSFIHAYAISILLSWSSLIYVVCVTFLTTDIYNINGTVVSTGLVYAPTITRFSPQHLPYAMPAVVLLFFFGVCPTLFLCLYPTRLFRKCCKVHTKLQLLLNTFADAFQCCYKDGLNGNYDFRFLSSAPMILFIIIFTIVDFFFKYAGLLC